MKTFSFILIFTLIICLQGFAQEQISLNGTWQFSLAKTDQEADKLADFYSPGFKHSTFTSIPVPSNWAVLGFEEPVYRGFEEDKAGEGFYLHEFSLPKEWKDKRVLLHFGGVWSSADIWLNGKHLGQHNSGYTSFAFDITGKVDTKKSNRLAVRVRQVSREYKFDVFDDWTLGGIYRDVTLEAMPRKRWLDAVVVRTYFDNQFNDADLKISTMVSDKNKTTLPGNYPSPGEPYDLRFTLTDKDGNEVSKRQITIPAHTATDREVSLTMHIASPHHWTAETPYLYNLRVDLLEKDELTHTRVERIGFRQISTEGGIFRINGQAVKLRGVNRHDEHPDVGRATTREHWLQDIKLMKAANINYVRMSHYTPAKGFIDLCDELGMYVGNEVSLGGAGGRMNDPSYAGAALVRSFETVVRDVNSPSIVYWSIGNEDPLTGLHLTSIKLVKALDPTRPVLIPWRSEGWLPEEIDILSSHYWQPNEYDKLAGQANRPIITTEYTHAYGVDGFGGLEARWKALTKHPTGAGGAIWMWADQGIKTPVINPKGKTSFNQGDEYLRIDGAGWDGIVDSYRKLTRDYMETKAVYAQVYPTLNKVNFTPGEAVTLIPIQNEFDFTNLNAVKVSWSLWEDDKELDSGSGSINGMPHAVATFELPIGKLNTVQSGKTYYAQFIFSYADGDGTEINRKSVELEPLMQPRQHTLPNSKLLVKKEKNVIVQSGDVSYTFNPQSGHLALASLQGKPMITDLRPIIWRKPDQSEVSVIGRKIVRDAADLNQYTASVKGWNVEETADEVIIHATVKYTVDKKNSFITNYRYSIGSDGQCYVRYEILPDVAVPCVPMVGMSLKSASELNNLRWLGLGPYDAYPNKQSAPILGVWGNVADECIGNKATRWIERSGSTGNIRVYNTGYMKYEKENPDMVHILSGVLARPEKGRKADDSFPELRTDTGKPFIGEFKIVLY